MSNSPAVRPQSSVPALANTPALDIGSDDITLPKLYKGEYQSAFVQDNLVPAGSLFTAAGQDDPEPQVLWNPKDGGDGVLAHVLSLRKGKSMTVDGEFQTWRFNDPDAPADADTTYTYVLALPETEDGADIPVKVVLSRTSTPTARRINFLLKKNEGRIPPWGLAFRLTTAPRESTKGSKTFKYFVFQARQVEADPANVELAEGLAELAASNTADVERSASSEPAI